MIRNSRIIHVVTILVVAFFVSGCQSSNNRWGMAWKERMKPKPKFQGLDDKEEVTYWPYKPAKPGPKNPMPDELKEKLAKRTEQSKQDAQLNEAISQGDACRKNGQFEEARLAYTQALMISRDNPAVHHRLAIIADNQRQFSIADEHYQSALRKKPRDVGILSDLGYSYMLRGNSQLAEQTLKQVLEIDRGHKGAMKNLGTLYTQQNRSDEALALFRNGMTESEAAQMMDRVSSQSPQRGSGFQPAANGNMAMASNNEDLSKMSFDQIRSKMASRAQEERQRRYEAEQQELNQARQNSAGAEYDKWEQEQQFAAQKKNQALQLGSLNQRPNGPEHNVVAQRDDDWGNPVVQPGYETQSPPTDAGRNSFANHQAANSNSQLNQQSGNGGSKPFEVIRGNIPRLQPGLPIDGQSHSPTPSMQQFAQANTQQGQLAPRGAGGVNSASQLATQLAMGAGPGSLFPVIPASGQDGVPIADQGKSYSNRFGGEFQQPPAYQNPQGWNNNRSIEQASGTSLPEENSFGGSPSIAPASPANQWSTPSSGRLDWQSDNTNSGNWANDLPNSGAAGTGMDSGAGQLNRNSFNDRRADLNGMSGEFSGFANDRQMNADTSRPYSGSWPNQNSIPDRQSDLNRSNNRVDTRGLNSQSGQNSDATINYGGSQNSNSLPKWPFAPNR